MSRTLIILLFPFEGIARQHDLKFSYAEKVNFHLTVEYSASRVAWPTEYYHEIAITTSNITNFY